ncbi:hypothetical protein MPSEU_001000800 [Mayamaea pseudoterrestris]|nr:hypothetical protein MPSEU_001000800 [Mayamaea pseudoterrestris]
MDSGRSIHGTGMSLRRSVTSVIDHGAIASIVVIPSIHPGNAMRHINVLKAAYKRRARLLSRPFSTVETIAAPADDSDIVIVGGGVIGCALARLLSLHAPSLSVTVVESSSGPRKALSNAASATTVENELPHARSYALSPASLEILGLPLSKSKTLAAHSRTGYYQSMQVWEAKQPASLLFRAQDIQAKHLGAVAEDAHLQSILWSQLDASSSCKLLTETSVSSVTTPSALQHGLVKVELQHKNTIGDNKDTTTLRTRLLVAADGGNSAVRRMTGIGTSSYDYGQAALTFTVELSQPHQGRAYQRFLTNGPLALLPTFSDHHAIIVWSTTPEIAKRWINKEEDAAELVSHLNELLQQGPELLDSLWPSEEQTSLPMPFRNILYGMEKVLETIQYGPAMGIQELQAPHRFAAPPLISSVVSPRLSFPLKLQTASSYTLPRLALAGDAAHSVHPMAGQGLNLGLQDVAQLVQVVKKATDAGMDPSTFLHEYESGRKEQVTMTVGGIHALHQMFHQQSTLAKHVKSLGMNLVQSVGPVRQRLVHAACWGAASESNGMNSVR